MPLCLLALTACNDGKKAAEERAQHERDSLIHVIDEKETELNDIMGSINEIQEGFRQINEAEGRITVANGNPESASSREVIHENMQFIQQTMQQNRDKIAQLNSFVKRYQRLSIYDTVVAIREELDLDNIVAKWGDATQRKHNLSSVVNLAKAYDDMCRQMGLGSSILGFIRYLTITKPQNKPDNAANTVKVLTYHRAKGLEWPVVILYQLWRKVDDNKELAEREFRGVNVLVDEDPETDVFNRGRHIVLFPFGIGGNGSLPALMQTSIENTLLFQALKRRAKEEALRVLYVGVTRAKDILVSFTSKKQNGGESISEWPKGLARQRARKMLEGYDVKNETVSIFIIFFKKYE